MIIGIDLHGVIDSDIEAFKFMLECPVEVGDKLYIISGPPKVDIEKELNGHGLYRDIHFDEIFSVVDFLKEKSGVNMWTDDKGRWWASDVEWWGSKAEICEKHNVDIMIDDNGRFFCNRTERHFEHKKTKFLLYMR